MHPGQNVDEVKNRLHPGLGFVPMEGNKTTGNFVSTSSKVNVNVEFDESSRSILKVDSMSQWVLAMNGQSFAQGENVERIFRGNKLKFLRKSDRTFYWLTVEGWLLAVECSSRNPDRMLRVTLSKLPK